MLNRRFIAIVAGVIMVYLGINAFAQPSADTTPPTITLIGSAEMTINVGTNFVDPGATAQDDVDGDLTSEIVVTGSVDEDIPGVYQLRYNVSDKARNAAEEVVRTVNVVQPEVEEPIIMLNSDNPLIVNVGSTYTDPFGTVLVDGEVIATLTLENRTGELDTNRLGTYLLYYNYPGALEVIRVVRVVDRTAPVITLLGDAVVNHEAGTPYTDAEATALDNYYGDLTANIVVNNPVDTSKLGTYTITYNVTDESGNIADEVTRTVIVQDTIDPELTIHDEGILVRDNNYIFEAIYGGKLSDIEPLVTAYDQGSNDLTNAIIRKYERYDYVSGEGYIWSEIDSNYTVQNANLFRITYTVTDAANHTVIVVKNIKVVHAKPQALMINETPISDYPTEYAQSLYGENYTDTIVPVAYDEYDDEWYNAELYEICHNGSCSSKALTISLTNLGIYELRYRVSDKTGNTKYGSRTLVVEDTLKPTFTVDGISSIWVKDPITLTINANDTGVGLHDEAYSFDGGTTWTSTNTKTYTGYKMVQIVVRDKAENQTVPLTVHVLIDVIKPNSPTVDLNGYNQEWTKNTVKINLSLKDSGSGFNTFQYSTDNGATWENTGSELIFNNDINVSIIFRALDNVGNEGYPTESYNIKVDKSAPEITFSPNGNIEALSQHSTVVNITDLNSLKANRIRYIWSLSEKRPDWSEWMSNGIMFNSGDTITSPTFDTGIYYLHIMAEDSLGNRDYAKSQPFYIYNPIKIERLESVVNPYNGYSFEFDLIDGYLIGDASNIILELYKDDTLLAKNTLKNNTPKRALLANLDGLSSPFAPFGDWDYVKDGYWTHRWYGSREIIPNKGIIKVTINKVIYSREINVNLQSVKPEVIDWITVLSNHEGYEGYGFNFGMKQFKIGDTSSVVTELYDAFGKLLAKNTMKKDKISELSELIEITSPFSPFGEFNYVADGYWTHKWSGSKEVVPAKAKVILKINGVTYEKMVDIEVAPAVKPEVIDWITVLNNHEGYEGYGFNFGMKQFKIGDTSSVVTELYDAFGKLLAKNTMKKDKISELSELIEITSPFSPFGEFNYVADGYWTHKWSGSKEVTPAKAKVILKINGVTYEKMVDIEVAPAVKPEVIDWITVLNNHEGYEGYGFNFGMKQFKIGDTSSVITKLYDATGKLLARNTMKKDKISELSESIEITSPFAPFGDWDYVADGYWTHKWYGKKDIAPKKAVVELVIKGVKYIKEVEIDVEVASISQE